MSYQRANSESGQRVFVRFEVVIAILMVALALLAAWLMWTGIVSPL